MWVCGQRIPVLVRCGKAGIQDWNCLLSASSTNDQALRWGHSALQVEFEFDLPESDHD